MALGINDLKDIIRTEYVVDDNSKILYLDGITQFCSKIDYGDFEKETNVRIILYYVYDKIHTEKFYVLKPLDENDKNSYVFAKSMIHRDSWLILRMTEDTISSTEMSTKECQESFTSYIPGHDEKISVDSLGIDSVLLWTHYFKNIPVGTIDKILADVNEMKYNKIRDNNDTAR